jgi:hypothetical protein
LFFFVLFSSLFSPSFFSPLCPLLSPPPNSLFVPSFTIFAIRSFLFVVSSAYSSLTSPLSPLLRTGQ